MSGADPKSHTCSSPADQPSVGVNGDRFWQLLQAAPDGILEVGSDGRITLVNAAVQQMFGYSHAELVGQAIEMLVPTAKRTAHIHDRTAYVRNPRSRPMGPGLNLEAQRKDGTLFPVEISLSPNFSGPGESVIAIIRDVSERTRIEIMLKILKNACGRPKNLRPLAGSPGE
jgi:PAS domain S-box-containing protein